MKRGIIATPAIIEIHGDGFTVKRSLSPQELRYYLLYWDQVVIPSSNLIRVAIPEEEVLLETKVITRPTVVFSGKIGGADPGYSFSWAQSVVAQRLIATEKDIDWVVHQIGNQIAMPNEFKQNSQTIRVDLINALPVPNASVAIPDIVEFKERRKDELSALHLSLDEAYQEILKSPSTELASNRAIERLKKSIDDINSACSEKWAKTSSFDFSAEINLNGKDILTGIAAGAAFDFYTTALTIPIGTVVGALAPLLNLKAKVSSTFKPVDKDLKLSYLSHAHDEEIIE